MITYLDSVMLAAVGIIIGAKFLPGNGHNDYTKATADMQAAKAEFERAYRSVTNTQAQVREQSEEVQAQLDKVRQLSKQVRGVPVLEEPITNSFDMSTIKFIDTKDTSFSWSEATPLALYQNGNLLVQINQDGSPEFGPGFTADTAAREFWGVIGVQWMHLCELCRTNR